MSDNVTEAPGRGPWLRIAWPELCLAVSAVLLALLVGAAVIGFAGLDPVSAYLELWRGAFGSVRNTAETLVRFCPLAICALSVLVGFRAGFFTIGVEGQLYMGALASTLVALALPNLPPFVLIPLVMVAGMAAGMAWALVAGLLKVRLGVNEVISTIMLNYIAVLFVDFMVRGPIRDPNSDQHMTDILSENSWLPVILEKTRLHLGVMLPLLLAALVYFFFWRTAAGYRARISGANPTAARHAGINVNRSILLAVAISGALAGLAGAVEIQGVFHRLQHGIGAAHGYTAIAITLVGKTLPSATMLAALFFAALGVGATMMQMKAQVPLPIAVFIQGLVILFVVGSEALKSRVLGLWGWRTRAAGNPASAPISQGKSQ